MITFQTSSEGSRARAEVFTSGWVRGVAVAGALALVAASIAPAHGGYRVVHVAGAAERGYAGDGGPAVEALLDDPAALAFAADGALYVADTGNQRVRMIDAAGIIRTIAGSGERESSGDGGLAADAGLDQPRGVAVDGAGNIFIVEGSPPRVRRVDTHSGLISTFLGPGLADYAVANDESGDVFITLSPRPHDPGLAHLLRVSPGGGPFSFSPIPAADVHPYGLAASGPRNVVVAFGHDRHGIARADGRILWSYAPDEYAVRGPLGVALSPRRGLYVTAASDSTGPARFVLRALPDSFQSIAGGGAGEVVDGAEADTVALRPTAIAVAASEVLYVVHSPSQIFALEREPTRAGRITGRVSPYAQPRWPLGLGTGAISIYARGDNGVFRYTRPNRRGRFRFADLPPGRYTVHARFAEEGLSCDALDCGWSGAGDDCPRTLNDAVVEISAHEPGQRVRLFLLRTFPCI